MNASTKKENLFFQINSKTDYIVYAVYSGFACIMGWFFWLKVNRGIFWFFIAVFFTISSVWFLGRMVKKIRRFRPTLLADERVTDDDLTALRKWSSIGGLWLDDTQVTNDGLAVLASMSSVAELEQLWLNNTRIDDRGLEHIQAFTKLQELTIDGTQVTDEGLACLESLPSLVFLSLDKTGIDGRGLKHLQVLSKLEELSLEDTRITDESLMPLRSLPSLVLLSLKNTRITDRGVELLHQFPHLTDLSINRVSERAVRGICAHPTLKKIALDDTCATPSLVDQLKRQYPNLQIDFTELEM